MKVKSGQIYTENYTYTLDTTAQRFWFSKGRPEGVLELVWVSVYNKSANPITLVYFLMKHKGEAIRLLYDSSIAIREVDRWYWPVYLEDGDEFGLEMTGDTIGDLVEVAAQWIYHSDRD